VTGLANIITSTENKSNSILNAQAMTLLAAFFWGTSFVIVELGLEYVNPYWFAQLRFLIASVGALGVVLLFKKQIQKELILSHWIWLLGTFNALGFLGQFVAQTMTNATKTALLINMNLITVAALSSVLFHERFTRKKVLTVCLSILGVFLLTTDGNLSRLARGEFIGDMLALCGGFVWAFYIVTNKKVVTKPNIDIISLTACVMLATTIVMIPFTLILGGISSRVLNIGLEGAGAVVYLGIFCNVIPFLLWTFGLKYLMPTVSTLMLLFEVFIASILAFLILHEGLGIIGVIGGFVIIIAIVIMGIESKKLKKKKK